MKGAQAARWVGALKALSAKVEERVLQRATCRLKCVVDRAMPSQ